MPRAATRPFVDRILRPTRMLRAINEHILEPGDEPVTMAELQRAYESVETIWRPKRKRDEYGRLQPLPDLDKELNEQ